MWKIEPELFQFPANLVLGVLFLAFLTMFHVISKKVKKLQWFSGYGSAITALTLFLSLMVIMGLTGVQITASWPFVLLSLYLLGVLGLIILRRMNSFRWKDCGFFLNHAGLFIAFFAALLGSSDVQRLRMTVPIGETEWRATNEQNVVVELPLSIELKSFTIDEYPPKLMLLDHSTSGVLHRKKQQSLSVESYPMSATLSGWELDVVNYLPAAAAIANRDTVNYMPYHWEGATCAVYVKARNIISANQEEGWVSCGNHQFPYAALRLDENGTLIMPDREPKCFVSDVTVYTKSGATKSALIEVNKPVFVGGWKIYQSSYDSAMGRWSRYSVFELVKDPWLYLVYTGIAMMCAGAVILLTARMRLFIKWKYKWAVAISIVISFILIFYYLIYPKIDNKALMPALQSPWFVPHVVVYMVAYSLFCVATINALFLLFRSKKRERMDLCDNLVYMGTAFLTLGMLMGALWAKEAWGHYWSWDPKETWAAATWLCYLIYIHFRHHKQYRQNIALYILVFAFLVLQLCWVGVNYLPSAQNSIHVYR